MVARIPHGLYQYLTQQLPTTPRMQVFALDGTAWPRPSAAALPDRQYVYSPTKAVNGGSVVVGSPYSLLTWVAEPQSSWALPLDVERIASDQNALTVGIARIQRLCQHRQQQVDICLHLVVADAKYGNHRFLRRCVSLALSSAGEDMEARSIAHRLQHLYRIALELTPPGRDHFYRAAGSFQYRLKVPL